MTSKPLLLFFLKIFRHYIRRLLKNDIKLILREQALNCWKTWEEKGVCWFPAEKLILKEQQLLFWTNSEGMTGLGQIIHAIVPAIPVGSAVIALNLPLFLLGWRLLGWKLLASSLFATAATSLGVDLLAACYSFPPMDPMLASVFGGALIGLSLGMVFLQGATTGGTDLIARLLKLRFGHLPMGTLVMAVDLVVIALAALAFHSLSSALYGLVSLYISSLVIDRVLYGLDNAKVAYIISDRPQEIIRSISTELDRGVTILRGAGAWSGEAKDVLMCAFKQKQIVALKRAVKETDPSAFLIVCDAHEVLGQGFHSYHQHDL